MIFVKVIVYCGITGSLQCYWLVSEASSNANKMTEFFFFNFACVTKSEKSCYIFFWARAFESYIYSKEVIITQMPKIARKLYILL